MQNSNIRGLSTSETKQRKKQDSGPHLQPYVIHFHFRNLFNKKNQKWLILLSPWILRVWVMFNIWGERFNYPEQLLFLTLSWERLAKLRFPSSWASVPAIRLMLGEHMAAPPRAAAFKKTVLLLFLHNKDKKMRYIISGFESSFTNTCGDEIQLLAAYKWGV